MDGLILVDKPRGATSHDIVARVRRCLAIQRVGHFGTLDPLATGLLLVAVGRAVKLFPFFSKLDKVYSGEIRLGLATDTYDAMGRPSAPVAGALPRREAVVAAMSLFVGEILQAPPPYSAKKLAGKPLYKWARSRQTISCPPRPVKIDAFEMTDYRPPVFGFNVRCGSGTYVRSLAHALGEKLGCGAHLAALRRLSVGDFSVADAFPVDRLEILVSERRADVVVRPLESLLPGLPKLILTETAEGRLQRGRRLAPGDIKSELPAVPSAVAGTVRSREVHRLFSITGRFLGLAERAPDPESFVPFLVIAP